jgi:hypothetical protein
MRERERERERGGGRRDPTPKHPISGRVCCCACRRGGLRVSKHPATAKTTKLLLCVVSKFEAGEANL